MNPTKKAPGNGGPRIYNLFPSLVGPVELWRSHLPRIAHMDFNWLYLNPVHYPGFSGSLYAIKDPYRLNDLFVNRASTAKQDPIKDFTSAAATHGLRVMMDLVINHTAKDALLVGEHPGWYRRDPDGELISPHAVDPANTTNITVWGDLAELDYSRPDSRAGLIDYWKRYILHCIRIGVSGFRCDAAYKIAPDIWRELIEAAVAESPLVQFFAETLGCTLEQMEGLRAAGFNYVFNSSKWWDFRSDWLLDQYEAFRQIAPSISFPESHDTERLASSLGTDDSERIAAHAKFHYLFAACFSTGVMIPIGYEYGFRKRLDVVHTRPEDWEHPSIDISDFIAATNAVKKAIPILNMEGPERRLTSPGSKAIALFREAVDRNDGCALLLINPDADRSHAVDPGFLLAESGGIFSNFEDVTPHASPIRLEPGIPITLDCLEMRVFRGESVSRAPSVGKSRSAAAMRGHSPSAEGRVTIENVWPEIDGGRHPAKRVVGDTLEVWADIFCDGHDIIEACVRYKALDEDSWREVPMTLFDNDSWVGRFPLGANTRYRYSIAAWRNLFATWRRDVVKKRDAGQPVSLELTEGRALVAAALAESQAKPLAAIMKRLDTVADEPTAMDILLSDNLDELMRRFGVRTNLSMYDKELEAVVDRTAARYGAWYELFPRSMSDDPARHGTFDDVIAHLPYIRDMGFDVLYMPPIHPIGTTNRKGRNNSLVAAPRDPGSVYAIGSPEGGHTAIHPELGTVDDFGRLVAEARRLGLEIALDFAIQVSPDHPWIKECPEWFDWRPDGTIKFAENPPKKYEDIVNVHFYRGAFPSLWYALRDVFLFWISHGVKIFRVDNPHTKPVPFWEWVIREIQDQHPDVILLSEAFTRPKMMKKLAKVGFTQSYTYFTWRNTKAELTEYLTELTQSPCKEYLRPNFFVNTPDINPPFLQTGGRPAFQIRSALAATLSSLWGMYSGFELCEATPIPGREEYFNSEKYEIKAWDWDRPGNIRAFITRLNRIRRSNPALHDFLNLRFYPAYDDHVLFYGKATPSRDNIVWIAVNLDPYAIHEADIDLPLHELHLDDGSLIDVEELLSGARFQWHGRRQRIRLDPHANPCAIWRITPHERA
jgi:starch synthase (maltosyl-transferring)